MNEKMQPTLKACSRGMDANGILPRSLARFPAPPPAP